VLRALPFLIVVLAGCGDRAENEARLFLDRSELLTLEGAVEGREQMIAAVEALPLTNEEVMAVRDACVRGHRALIEAEVAQREATVELNRASGGREDSKIPAAEAARIQAMIDRSNTKIRESGEELEACEEGKRNLRRGLDEQR
jgi:hypothetical protein